MKNFKPKYVKQLMIVAIQARDLVESIKDCLPIAGGRSELCSKLYVFVSKRKFDDLKKALEALKADK